MRAFWAPLLMLAAALAGCSDSGSDDGTGDGTPTGSQSGTTSASTSRSTSSTATTTTSGNGGSGGDEDGAPEITRLAAAQGNQSVLLVTFDLDASDPDDDPLTWELDADGDGTADHDGDELPATVEHTFGEAGLYEATLTVGDGALEATRTLEVNVTLAGAQDIDVTWDAAHNLACSGDATLYDTIPDTDGTTYASFAVVPATQGLAFTVSFDSKAAQDHLVFFDAAGAVLLDVEVGLPDDATWEATGTVPDGAVLGVFFGCGGLPDEHVVYHAGA